MTNGEAATPETTAQRRVIIRPYPKIVFFYPTWILCLVCALVMTIAGDTGTDLSSQTAKVVGLLFFYIFAFNLLVVGFEFTRILAVALVFFVGMLIFLGMWLATKVDFLAFLGEISKYINPRMTVNYFWVTFILFSVVYLIVFLQTRFNYWEIQHNELLHHHGFMGDVERYPAPNLRMSKEINDVVEYVMLWSGRLILNPSSERQAIVLECVININKVETRVKSLLGSLQVTMRQGATD